VALGLVPRGGDRKKLPHVVDWKACRPKAMWPVPLVRSLEILSRRLSAKGIMFNWWVFKEDEPPLLSSTMSLSSTLALHDVDLTEIFVQSMSEVMSHDNDHLRVLGGIARPVTPRHWRNRIR